MMYLILFLATCSTVAVVFLFIRSNRLTKRMTDLEKELINLAQKQEQLIENQNKMIEELRNSQLKVLEDEGQLILTYKDQIIYKAKPQEK